MAFLGTITRAIISFFVSKEVCFNGDGIGCFSNKKPFDNALRKLPQSPGDQHIRFLLWTRQNKNQYQVITRDANSIKASNFKGTRDTKFIVHGWKGRGTESDITNMKDAFLTKEDANVIGVDWEKGADDNSYSQSAANTRVVGAMTGELIKALHNTEQAPYNSMHLIGHSLGAQSVGYAGERVSGIGRITGLDPAGPYFEDKDTRVRIDPGDAQFVDIIHTDGESLLELGFGMEQAAGHVDFYPNGGEDQPGCKNNLGSHILNFFKGGPSGFTRSIGCSHLRAIFLFTESITSSCGFKAFPCGSKSDFNSGKCNTCKTGCNNMGYRATKSKTGKFYLKTRGSSPYCIA